MATAGKQNGTLTYISDGGVQLDFLTEVSIEFTRDMIDTTTKDSSGWRNILPGKGSISYSGTAYHAEDATEGSTEQIGNIVNRTAATLKWTTGVTGDEYIQCTGYLSSFSASAGTEDVRSFSFTYEVDGAPTIGDEA